MTRAAAIPEKAIQQQIVSLLRRMGGTVYVIGTRRRRGDFQGTMQTPGIPDLYVFLPAPRNLPFGSLPIAVWIECKAIGGRLSPEQVSFRNHCDERQLSHIVGGVDEVVAFLVNGGWLKSEQLPHYRRSPGTAVHPVAEHRTERTS